MKVKFMTQYEVIERNIKVHAATEEVVNLLNDHGAQLVVNLEGAPSQCASIVDHPDFMITVPCYITDLSDAMDNAINEAIRILDLRQKAAQLMEKTLCFMLPHHKVGDYDVLPN